jgi:NO-binding membrane sensor protein with MHYT domain
MPVSYDATLTLLSLLLAIAAPAVGLYIVGRGQGSFVKLVIAGVFTGLGVAVMHYTGMAAMIMPATIQYDPTLYNASLVIAVVAAIVALWLAFNLRGNLQRFGSALVMGVAVCGMHYTGMYALQMTPAAQPTEVGIAVNGVTLGQSVFGVSAVLLVLLLMFNSWKAKRALMAEL